ncbi:hypothetical protein B0H14DRAFT_2596018 [Mycena olivaceomarginata]|nr:hypothetical protein B0H14DRAFT_2596018 [Mycena olivaceomarginata]
MDPVRGRGDSAFGQTIDVCLDLGLHGRCCNGSVPPNAVILMGRLQLTLKHIWKRSPGQISQFPSASRGERAPGPRRNLNTIDVKAESGGGRAVPLGPEMNQRGSQRVGGSGGKPKYDD